MGQSESSEATGKGGQDEKPSKKANAKACLLKHLSHDGDSIPSDAATDEDHVSETTDDEGPPKPTTLDEAYEVIGKLGGGGFGEVFKVLEKKTGALFALKVITFPKDAPSQLYKMVGKETRNMRLLQGVEGVITLHKTEPSIERMRLVLDFCAGGELAQSIMRNPNYSEAHAAEITRRVLKIIASCHERGVVHCDIKPQNFMYRDESKKDLVLIDFGLSATKPKRNSFLKVFCGTPSFMAPEILNRHYDEKVDIWAVGCLLYLILSGSLPFRGKSEKEIFAKVKAGKFDLSSLPWPSVSAEAKEVISQMLEFLPENRPSAASLLSNSWIKEGGLASASPIESIKILHAGMCEFYNMNELKKIALLDVARIADTAKLDKLNEHFKAIDLNSSGKISLEELQTVTWEAGFNVSGEELKGIVKAYDVDKDGKFSYHEFIAATAAHKKLYTVQNLRAAFDKYNTDDRKESLSASEIRRVLEENEGKAIPPHTVDAIIADIDQVREVTYLVLFRKLTRIFFQDGSGEIDFKEFCDLFEVKVSTDDEA